MAALMLTPSEEMLERNLSILGTGRRSATYKPALSLALVDLSVERTPADGGSVVLPLRHVAERVWSCAGPEDAARRRRVSAARGHRRGCITLGPVGLRRDLLVAALRAFVQLLAVGSLLTILFTRAGLLGGLIWVAGMVVIAGLVAAGRSKELPKGWCAILGSSTTSEVARSRCRIA